MDHDAGHIWREVLDQLRLAMPKTTFEAWVRDTQALRFEGDVLIVRARNGYARDRLAAYLTTPVERMLAGLLGRENAHVAFVVADESGGQPEADGEDDKLLEIRAEYDSVYERVVHPTRAVYLPGYFRRHLPLLGPDLAWFYVGFRQAAYASGGRGGQRAGRFSGRQIAALCGITERTFWNRVGRGETWDRLAGLVKPEVSEAAWRKRGDELYRLARRYTVAMTLPLTAADARALSGWIAHHIERYGGAEGVLEAACQAPPDELLSPDGEAGDFRPLTVHQLIQDIFPGQDLKGLAERLHLHLMPQRDQIVISLFFLEHILPWLGAGPAWMYVLLRDRCYQDAWERRDTVMVPGGYAEIAGWLGIKRPQTVYDWLRDSQNPIPQIYMACERVGWGGAGKWGHPLAFRVLLNDIPDEIVHAALTQEEWRGFQYQSNAIFSIGVTRSSVSSNANFSLWVTRISEFGNAIFSIFKLLNSLNKPLNSPDPTTSATWQPQAGPALGDGQLAVAETEIPSAWDLERLFEINKVSPKKRQALRQVGATGRALVSWLLYSVSAEAEAQAIQSPLGYALSQLEISPTGGKHRDFDALAALPPRRLIRMLSGGGSDDPQYALFHRRMIGQPPRPPRYRALVPILLGEEAAFS